MLRYSIETRDLKITANTALIFESVTIVRFELHYYKIIINNYYCLKHIIIKPNLDKTLALIFQYVTI